MSPYGIDKRASELALGYYTAVHGVATTALRFFNVFGPRQDPTNPYSGVISIFADRARAGRDLTIFGDGGQTRAFCYVDDLVDGILKLMDSNVNEPVNIGNPHEVTIEEIARTIIALVGSRSRIVYRPLPVDDPKQRRPDITRARTILGWEPKVGLEEGLATTVEYFKQKVAAADRLPAGN